MVKAFVVNECKVFKTNSMTRHSKSRRHIGALWLKKIQAHSNIVEAKDASLLAKMMIVYFEAKTQFSKGNTLIEFL